MYRSSDKYSFSSMNYADDISNDDIMKLANQAAKQVPAEVPAAKKRRPAGGNKPKTGKPGFGKRMMDLLGTDVMEFLPGKKFGEEDYADMQGMDGEARANSTANPLENLQASPEEQSKMNALIHQLVTQLGDKGDKGEKPEEKEDLFDFLFADYDDTDAQLEDYMKDYPELAKEEEKNYLAQDLAQFMTHVNKRPPVQPKDEGMDAKIMSPLPIKTERPSVPSYKDTSIDDDLAQFMTMIKK